MAEEEEFRYPLGVTSDEDGDNIVRVCIVIPGLEKKMIGDEAKNASINFKVEQQSMEVIIRMTKKKDKFRYKVKKFPDIVDPTKCTFKVKKDQVVVKLFKKEARSWARELGDTGLECEESSSESEGDN